MMDLDRMEWERQNCLAMIKEDPRLILTFSKWGEDFVVEAVQENPFVLKFLPKASECVQWEALKKEPKVLRWIKNPTLEMVQFAISKNTYVIHYLSEIPEAWVYPLIQANPLILAYEQIDQAQLSEADWVKLLEVRPDAFPWIRDQYKSERLCRLAVEGLSTNLHDVPKALQTESLWLMVLKKGDLVIPLDQLPTKRLQLERLKKCPYEIGQLSVQDFIDEEMLLTVLRETSINLENWKNVNETAELAVMTRHLQREFRGTPMFLLPSFWEEEMFEMFSELNETYSLYTDGVTQRIFDLRKGFMYSFDQALANEPKTLALFPLKERNYQRCRLAVRLNDQVKIASPYHALEVVSPYTEKREE